jgi:RNA-directed DNA polymerase
VRRVGGLWLKVASFDALLAAAKRAASGKRTARSAARFLERAEVEALALERELLSGTWRPGRGSSFEITDPKPRTITAVPFRDQVVHHALMAALEPVFERRMIFDSYACRTGKGTHRALSRARHFVRRFAYFLKMDVASFFPSTPHASVMEALSRVVKDRDVLALCATILRGPPGEESDRGLPIGSLTSQWFANLLLDRLDHHVKETMRIPGYLRYMDDFVLFADERARLHEARADVEAYLASPLGLRAKPKATLLAPTSQGLPFLGWLVFRGLTRVRPANLRRFRWRLRQRRWEVARGLRSAESYRQGVASVYEMLRHGSTLALRRGLSERDDTDP